MNSWYFISENRNHQNYLVDTHLILWLLAGSQKLPKEAKTLMESPGGIWYASVISVWEVMLKHQIHPNKMPIDAKTFAEDSQAAGFKILPLVPDHIFEAANLPTKNVHKDPFDRMLLAQARAENFTLLTHDKAFASYDDRCVFIV